MCIHVAVPSWAKTSLDMTVPQSNAALNICLMSPELFRKWSILFQHKKMMADHTGETKTSTHTPLKVFISSRMLLLPLPPHYNTIMFITTQGNSKNVRV